MYFIHFFLYSSSRLLVFLFSSSLSRFFGQYNHCVNICVMTEPIIWSTDANVKHPRRKFFFTNPIHGTVPIPFVLPFISFENSLKQTILDAKCVKCLMLLHWISDVEFCSDFNYNSIFILFSSFFCFFFRNSSKFDFRYSALWVETVMK